MRDLKGGRTGVARIRSLRKLLFVNAISPYDILSRDP
jgi:hypothetical protein